MYSTKVWLSYDLGTLGDYDGLYSWLDDHDAEECGQSVATLTYEYENDALQELNEELDRSVELDRKSRIYVMFRDQVENRAVGRFIKGRRKQAPWTGYGSHPASYDDCD